MEINTAKAMKNTILIKDEVVTITDIETGEKKEYSTKELSHGSALLYEQAVEKLGAKDEGYLAEVNVVTKTTEEGGGYFISIENICAVLSVKNVVVKKKHSNGCAPQKLTEAKSR